MDNKAAAGPLVFLVALAIVTTALGGLLLQTQSTAEGFGEVSLHTASLSIQATNIASLLLDQPGAAADGGSDWSTDPDNSTRLGLASSRPSFLDFDKLHNLQSAPFQAGADGYLNYEEARTRLGLDAADLDFHVRAVPLLHDVRSMLQAGGKDQFMRAAYIGNALTFYDDTDLPLLTSAVDCTGSGSNWLLRLDATNIGTTTTQFNLVLQADIDGASLTLLQNGPPLAPAASHQFTVEIPNHGAGICDAGTTITAELYDPVGRIDTRETTFTTAATADGTAPHDLSVDTGKPYYLDTDKIVVDYSSTRPETDLLELEIKASNGTVVHQATFEAGPAAKRTHPLAALPAGTYDVHLSDANTTVDETLVVRSAPLDAYQDDGSNTAYVWHSAVDDEVGYLDELVASFCPYIYDDASTSPLADPAPHADRCGHLVAPVEGSVFPDMRQTLNDDLPDYLLDSNGDPRFDHFNLLVVGSNVDHNSMTSASSKHAIRDWVLGGGTLIVFGSEAQAVNWLQPIFHSAIKSSSGGISAPDVEHPVLRTSDPLAWADYSTFDRSWRFSAGADDHFTNVVNQGGDPVLAVSDPGSLGQGNVFLTTWQPWDLHGDGESQSLEALKVLNNLIQLGYRELFLDYGPEIPPGSSVQGTTRIVQMEHPDLGVTTMYVTVYVFSA